MNQHDRAKRGLTLIELVVVIAVLSMLMAAVGVYAVGVFAESKRSVARQDIGTAMNALEVFHAMRGHYPASSEGFAPLVEARVLKHLPTDPWQTPLTYTLQDGEPVVTSLGADRARGGEKENADLSSRDAPP